MDRKNNELEKIKKDNRNKLKDNEDLINSLERKGLKNVILNIKNFEF